MHIVARANAAQQSKLNRKSQTLAREHAIFKREVSHWLTTRLYFLVLQNVIKICTCFVY
jgi:hypothetical protein